MTTYARPSRRNEPEPVSSRSRAIWFAYGARDALDGPTLGCGARQTRPSCGRFSKACRFSPGCLSTYARSTRIPPTRYCMNNSHTRKHSLRQGAWRHIGRKDGLSMRPSTFKLFRPVTVDEAVALLNTHAPDIRVLAGGQSLMPIMKLRLAAPGQLVDLMKLEELQGITREADGTVVIGAMTTHDAVASSGLLAERLPVLAETATHIADMQVRNRGTIGGACCQFLSESDYPPVLTILSAEFEIRAASGTRRIAAADFFQTALVTAVGDGELLTSIRIPSLPPRTGGAHDKITRRFNDFGLISGAALITLTDSDRASDVRVALGNVGPRPVRASSVEAALIGQVLGGETIASAASAVTADVYPADDNHASADYRRKVAPVLVERLLLSANHHAKEVQ